MHLQRAPPPITVPTTALAATRAVPAHAMSPKSQSLRPASVKGQFLRKVRDGACQVFLTTLSPDYNAQHHDHFHLDMGGWAKCA